MQVDWLAFVRVFATAFVGSVSLVLLYALGMRLLVRAGRVKHVGAGRPVEAIMRVTDKDRERAAKRASKAASASPLTAGQRTIALVAAHACLALCVFAAGGGIFFIVRGH